MTNNQDILDENNFQGNVHKYEICKKCGAPLLKIKHWKDHYFLRCSKSIQTGCEYEIDSKPVNHQADQIAEGKVYEWYAANKIEFDVQKKTSFEKRNEARIQREKYNERHNRKTEKGIESWDAGWINDFQKGKEKERKNRILDAQREENAQKRRAKVTKEEFEIRRQKEVLTEEKVALENILQMRIDSGTISDAAIQVLERQIEVVRDKIDKLKSL